MTLFSSRHINIMKDKSTWVWVMLDGITRMQWVNNDQLVYCGSDSVFYHEYNLPVPLLSCSPQVGDQRWGYLSNLLCSVFSPFFSEWPKHWLLIEYHIHISQVSLQLSCGDTCEIWMWFKGSDWYFCKSNISPDKNIDEQSLVIPTW